MRGSNLPRFREAQLAFAAHIRDPEQNPPPTDVEARRMRIYVELFYNNVEHFLAGAFPVVKRTLEDAAWHALARGFLREHRATTPYFQEIAQEYLEYLATQHETLAARPFLLELAHYEWVELALAVAVDELPTDGVDASGDLMDGVPVISPLAWSLSYRFPVHRIGPQHQPTVTPPEQTHLIVYRNRADQVKFMESNVVTARLLALLTGGEMTEGQRAISGRDALARVALELGRGDPTQLMKQGSETLEALRACDIIAGTRTSR